MITNKLGIGMELAGVIKPIQNESIINDRFNDQAVICDIDGTVARRCNRDIFDYTKVSQDLPYRDIFYLLRLLYMDGHEIIFVTGRNDDCEGETAEWLLKNFDYEFSLYMRKTGDNRPDEIVKKEILVNDILPNYYVVYVFDDRNKVVSMWRTLGLRCFQVADGDF